jgi:hypothetical protein
MDRSAVDKLTTKELRDLQAGWDPRGYEEVGDPGLRQAMMEIADGIFKLPLDEFKEYLVQLPRE